MRSATLLLMAASGMLFTAAHAEPLRGVIDDLGGSPEPAARVERIKGMARSEVDVALAEYDEQIRLQPFDVTHRVRRCRFIEEFIAQYEYATFMEELDTLSQDCQEQLAEEYGEHPEVQLWQLERTYGEALIERGTALAREGIHLKWTSGQLARLYTMLARAFDLERKPAQAIEFALQALTVDEEADVRLIAATHLVGRGQRDRALQILGSPIDGSDPKDGWSLVNKMNLLAELGAADRVVELHAKLRAAEGYSHTEAARALRTAGATTLARQELELASKRGDYSTADEQERFKFELEFGTPQQALAAYDSWRDGGWAEDPLGINRFALAMRDWSLPWRLRDFAGVAGFFGALAALALAATVPIAVVHYRGLAVRAGTGAQYPSAGWQLRHAWAAFFAFGSASLLSLYTAGALDLTSDGGLLGLDATPAQLARTTLVEGLLAIVILMPLALRARSRDSKNWTVQWSIAKCVLVGAALGLAFRIPLLLAYFARPDAVRMAAPDDAIWQIIIAVRDHYGTLAALWLLSIAAPVIEEFVFRGVLYRAFTAHIGAGWANALQAALFSAIHLNLKAALFIFVVGLVFGTLTRRSGGLLASIVMHASFNLIAGLVFL